jgi:hypothetical protein
MRLIAVGKRTDNPRVGGSIPPLASSLGWTFSETDQFTFACLVSDRYKAGMKDMVIVES